MLLLKEGLLLQLVESHIPIKTKKKEKLKQELKLTIKLKMLLWNMQDWPVEDLEKY